MPEQDSTQTQYANFISDLNTKLRDIEEKQNLIKDRILLIGENLLAEKQETEEEIQKIKNQIKVTEQEVQKIKLGIERIINFQENFAKKSELEILKKQFKMFQPLELARISDVEEIIKNMLKNKNN